MGRTFVIAEAGVNHNGSLDTALQLVAAAKACGADAVKFQTFKAERLVTRSAEKAAYQKRQDGARDSQFEMLKRLELKDAEFAALMACCADHGIEFLSSPFDEESADFLQSLGMRIFKVPSGEITNLPFLAHLAAKGKPVILSTGMSTLGDVEDAVGVLRSGGVPQLTLLHCVTEYPAPIEEVNLLAMGTLRAAFRTDVGYSDHTPGIEIPLAAVALGASVIEKHFTLNTSMPGPDHKASLDPLDFQKMVVAIRTVEQALGDGIKRPAKCELKNIAVARKSVVAAQAIEEGQIITREMLAVKRPGNGIPPRELGRVIGLKAARPIARDTVLTWQLLT